MPIALSSDAVVVEYYCTVSGYMHARLARYRTGLIRGSLFQ